MSTTNDSAELEALFDSIASDFKAPAPAPAATAAVRQSAPAPVMPPPKVGAAQSVASSGASAANAAGDSDDLQALFDSVSAEVEAAHSVEGGGDALAGDEGWPKQEAVFNRIGHMARALHDTLGQLGYDKLLEKTMSALPDAKDRLAYVANLTEQAACRVLNATDVAVPLLDELDAASRTLGGRWDQAFANQLSTAEFKQLADETRVFLKQGMPEKTRAAHAQLTEIMMAQDFQDLTGQVIKKIVGLAQELESGLMNVLIDVMPETKITKEVSSLMNGPVVNAEGRTDVVVNQQQVDDLLDSLGF